MVDGLDIGGGPVLNGWPVPSKKNDRCRAVNVKLKRLLAMYERALISGSRGGPPILVLRRDVKNFRFGGKHH